MRLSSSRHWLHARLFTLLSLAILLAGCATSPPTSLPSSWEDQKRHVLALERWTAQGKIALRNSNAAESATLRWRQDGTDSQLKLSGPLGVGTTLIDSDGQTMRVEQGSDVRLLDVSTPEAIFQNTGWHLPLRALPYWLRGIPSPDYPIDALDLDEAQSTLLTLQQDGWLISYNAYADFSGATLPTRIVAERDSMRLKVIVRQWRDLATL